jgi:hypothetical protein
MYDIGSYAVTVHSPDGAKTAVLSPAAVEDMPSNWDFFWSILWENTSFEYQNIAKLTCEGQVWGLVRYSVYPISDRQNVMVLEIEHLEANPISRGEVDRRLVEPIGKWLIWYAARVALQYCLCADDDTAIVLAAVPDAVDYYRDVIEMEYLGVAPSAPGEDAYAFRFTRAAATAFCSRQEQEWGIPTAINA